jgi:hypothetical protein
MTESKVAESVASELANPAGPGERHSQMKALIMPLIEIGFSDPAIFSQFRGMYDNDLEDSEIESVIKWGRNRAENDSKPFTRKSSAKVIPPEEAIQNAVDWLDGFQADHADLWHASQVYPGEDYSRDSLLYLRTYSPGDVTNINTRYVMRKQKDGSEKAELCGPGETKLAADWIEWIGVNGPPEGRAGSWMRINPLRALRGASPSGAHIDADVLRYDRLLLESDVLPFDIALSLYTKIALPIIAIIDSAGRGPHAHVSIQAANAQEYAGKTRLIFDLLAPFGIDRGNGNPSRYSRLPGATRIIGARAGSSIQELLYLTPEPRTGGVFS